MATDNGAPAAQHARSVHGVNENTLTYPDGTQIVQRFTNGPKPSGPSVMASVTVSRPHPRTVDGQVTPDGRFWRVDLPELDMQIPVRFLEHVEQHTTTALAERLRIDPSLITLRLLRDGKPFVAPTPDTGTATAPQPRTTVTYRTT